MKAVWKLNGDEKMLLRLSESKVGSGVSILRISISGYDIAGLVLSQLLCGYQCINGNGASAGAMSEFCSVQFRHGSSMGLY